MAMNDPALHDIVAAYDAQAPRLAAEYERVDQVAYRSTFSDLILPGADRLALDVGAGSGRDAAWLAALGYDVVAAEPAAGMRTEARKLHHNDRIRWLDDRLPGLNATHALALSFDLILLSGVWQHVAPQDRQRGFRKLATLLKPGGLLIVTLRHGPASSDRPMYDVTTGEIEALARNHGLAIARVAPASDALGRPGVAWTTLAMTLPDDGAGALPLLRGIVLNDDKSSTYKLGLLRAIAKIADLTPSIGVPHPTDDSVEVPLGAVALNWVRMYLPLVRCGLPQMPGNAGPDGLGFAKEGFRALLADGIAPLDLRVGATFSGERAKAVAGAIADASRTIATMPANFIRYPNSEQRVFTAATARSSRGSAIALGADALGAFGRLAVPGHVWRTMQRLGLWIEPVLAAEWARLMRGYMERQGRSAILGELEAALAWIEPRRDVSVARDIAVDRLRRGERLHCVWSDRPLSDTTLDIDHCLPWSAWACGDLWNLMPSHRMVNQREKRGLLPSANALAAARTAIVTWWDDAWLSDEALAARFASEAGAALPVEITADSDAIFDGLAWRRLRLRQDQQLTEWAGPRPS